MAYRKLPSNCGGYESHSVDEIRGDIDRITSYMFTNSDSVINYFSELVRRLKKRDEETKDICLRSRINPEPYLLSNKFQHDIYRRCGNRILDYLKEAKMKSASLKKG